MAQVTPYLVNGLTQVVWGAVVGISLYGQYRFPRAPGVYVFAQVDARGATHVRYVGQASNLDDRIYAHLGGYGNNMCLKTVLGNALNVRIRAAVQYDKGARANLEHTYYKHYSKRRHRLCNALKPKGRYLEGVMLPF